MSNKYLGWLERKLGDVEIVEVFTSTIDNRLTVKYRDRGRVYRKSFLKPSNKELWSRVNHTGSYMNQYGLEENYVKSMLLKQAWEKLYREIGYDSILNSVYEIDIVEDKKDISDKFQERYEISIKIYYRKKEYEEVI